MIGAPVAVALLLVGRCWWAGVVAGVVTIGCVVIQLPLFLASTAPIDGHTFVALTANLRLGHGNAGDLVAAVERHHVDALMLQELTVAEQQRLVAAGLDRVLPFHASEPRPYAYGTGLWSRYPLTDINLRHDFTCSFVTADAHVPGLDNAITLAAIHMAGPWPKSVHWQYDMRRMPQALLELAHRRPTVLVGGDFNATPDVAQFRRLLTNGYTDAADQAGAGFTRTYPSDQSFPPLIAIDHVLTRNATATRVSTVEIPGSDHRALLVTAQLPRRI